MVNEFTDYVSRFEPCPAITYKYEHSLRVMNLIQKLGESINLKKDEMNVAKLIGLIHDYARFPQWNIYKNFDDLKTFDHADEAVQILFDQGEIEKYNLHQKYYKIVYNAVLYHNKWKIGKVDEQSLIFCKLIRDADKLDIISQFTKGIFNDTDENYIHDEVKKSFFNHQSVKKIKDSTVNDRLVIMIALIYDLNFEFSFHYLVENDIINKIEKQVDYSTFGIYFEEIEKYIKTKLDGGKNMLDKKYDHLKTEDGKYAIWKDKGYFKANNKSNKNPYCIVIPPPNVTGKLHLGHAYDTAIQDIIIRYKRMQGFDTLWLPGMDHAAIATEAKVVKKLKDQGINKYEYGREKFLDSCWDWTHEYSKEIRNQWAKLGLSLDYDKERFTLDDGLSKAVNKVFVDYYNKGLIYRGEKIINWDPVAQTALSNEEVIYNEVEAAFYHLKYMIENEDNYLEVATTRPETLFGDTAVAVNPNDDRYQKYIGKNVVLPIVGKLIPIIADEHADPEFGTGVVKITPAHDPNDFEVGNRHNLERIVVINKDGTMNENAFQYVGMSREECRNTLVEDLKKAELLIEIEPITHSVGHSERTGVMVEPYLSKQWFVKMRPLADTVLENQSKKQTKINFVPTRYEKTMNHWMEITYDWCISRQLWWGHRIPAWYKGEEVYVGINPPTGDGWVQETDVLDTWFSSALWPFATLGWPDETIDLEKYFPNDCLVTGYDIIPFWVNRMAFQSLELLQKIPFKDCVIHGLIRDKEGRKFSKSLGNGIDPFDMCEKYGADSLRYYLTTDVSLGTDLKFDEVKISSTWNYINKIWNASRYVLMNIDSLDKIVLDELTFEDKWILTKYEKIVKSMTKHMDKYEFNVGANELYNFVWNDFCSNYIELSKHNIDSKTTKSILHLILEGILKMLHPFMPFVTEEIYQKLPLKSNDSIMISSYPLYDKSYLFTDIENIVDKVLEDIVNIRNLKATNKVTKDAFIKIDKSIPLDTLKIYKAQLKITDDKLIDEDNNILNRIDYESSNIKISYFFEGVTANDANEEEIKKLQESIMRREKLLSNENYVNKAPKNIVDLDRQKLEEEKQKLELLKR